MRASRSRLRLDDFPVLESGDNTWGVRLPFERIFELVERIGVEDGVDDDFIDEGFEPRDFDEAL